MLPGFFKKDSYFTGVVVGIFLPVITFGIVWIIDQLLYSLTYVHLTRQMHYLYLLSAAINVVPIRYYLVNLKAEKSGIGTLVITGAYILAYFFMFYQQ
jgi:hypothetical protein